MKSVILFPFLALFHDSFTRDTTSHAFFLLPTTRIHYREGSSSNTAAGSPITDNVMNNSGLNYHRCSSGRSTTSASNVVNGNGKKRFFSSLKHVMMMSMVQKPSEFNIEDNDEVVNTNSKKNIDLEEEASSLSRKELQQYLKDAKLCAVGTNSALRETYIAARKKEEVGGEEPQSTATTFKKKKNMGRYVPNEFTIEEEDDDNGYDENDENRNVQDNDDDADYDHNGYDEEYRLMSRSDWNRKINQNRNKKNMGGTSWIEKNAVFSNDDDDNDDDNQSSADNNYMNAEDNEPRRRNGSSSPHNSRKPATSNRTFRQDFRGTRVFVQGLPLDASWQDVKDHFRIAGEVVFASVSIDSQTGESKGHGVVQFETTEMAQNAIKVMRNHPLDGNDLYVREDRQEQEGGEGRQELRNRFPKTGGRSTNMPSEWQCADDENTELLSQQEQKEVLELIDLRDKARRKRKYEESDGLREQLKHEYGVHLDDRLKQWWVSADGSNVPRSIRDIKGDGRWGKQQTWRMIPTTPENDACVNPDLVNALLLQRDLARKEKDFGTADALLEEARTSPDGDLYLRIHDESRTWRIWTDDPPPRPVQYSSKSAAEQCVDLVRKVAPEKEEEIIVLLKKFPGREYNILKKLKQRYG